MGGDTLNQQGIVYAIDSVSLFEQYCPQGVPLHFRLANLSGLTASLCQQNLHIELDKIL
jgi:hypothetical protein